MSRTGHTSSGRANANSARWRSGSDSGGGSSVRSGPAFVSRRASECRSPRSRSARVGGDTRGRIRRRCAERAPGRACRAKGVRDAISEKYRGASGAGLSIQTVSYRIARCRASRCRCVTGLCRRMFTPAWRLRPREIRLPERRVALRRVRWLAGALRCVRRIRCQGWRRRRRGRPGAVTWSGTSTRAAPARSHARALSNWSAPCGTSTSGSPAASAASVVPVPAWQRTAGAAR